MFHDSANGADLFLVRHYRRQRRANGQHHRRDAERPDSCSLPFLERVEDGRTARACDDLLCVTGPFDLAYVICPLLFCPCQCQIEMSYSLPNRNVRFGGVDLGRQVRVEVAEGGPAPTAELRGIGMAHYMVH
jgi:hypothetical protein